MAGPSPSKYQLQAMLVRECSEIHLHHFASVANQDDSEVYIAEMVRITHNIP